MFVFRLYHGVRILRNLAVAEDVIIMTRTKTVVLPRKAFENLLNNLQIFKLEEQKEIPSLYICLKSNPDGQLSLVPEHTS